MHYWREKQAGGTSVFRSRFHFRRLLEEVEGAGPFLLSVWAVLPHAGEAFSPQTWALGLYAHQGSLFFSSSPLGSCQETLGVIGPPKFPPNSLIYRKRAFPPLISISLGLTSWNLNDVIVQRE